MESDFVEFKVIFTKIKINILNSLMSDSEILILKKK